MASLAGVSPAGGGETWRDRARRGLLALILAIAVTPVFFMQSMTRGLNHDEHQHVAAGYLVGSEGMLPYRDFPYFHTPYLAYAYGAFLRPGGHLLLEARLLSILCATLTVALLLYTVLSGMKSDPPAHRIASAIVVALLLLISPAFINTVGMASNHEFSVLLALVAVLAQMAYLRRGAGFPSLFAAGLFLALAVGSRVTFAPLVLPFVASVFLPAGRPMKSRLAHVAIFGAGLFAGSIPLLIIFLSAPAQFLFGVLQFSQANVQYRLASGSAEILGPGAKLAYFVRAVILPNLPVFLALIAGLARYATVRRRKRERPSNELIFLVLLLPFVLIGSFAPSPLYNQYFYAPAVFSTLVISYCLSRLDVVLWTGRRLFWGAVVIAASAAVLIPIKRAVLKKFAYSSRWAPLRIHQRAAELKAISHGNAVLTLQPIIPLEAGLETFPAFVTGPFAWRVAPYIDKSQRYSLGIVGPGDLSEWLRSRPAPDILVGHEKKLDESLIKYAKEHGYRKRAMKDKELTLWVPPAAGSR